MTAVKENIANLNRHADRLKAPIDRIERRLELTDTAS